MNKVSHEITLDIQYSVYQKEILPLLAKLEKHFGYNKVVLSGKWWVSMDLDIFSGNHRVNPKITIRFSPACYNVKIYLKFKDTKYQYLLDNKDGFNLYSVDYDNLFKLITEYLVKE